MSQRLRHERAAVQQKSKWRLVGMLFAGIIGVVVVLGAIGLILILHTAPAPVIHADHAAARRLADEMQRAQIAAAAGSPAIVRADETELNSTIEEYLREANRKLAGRASAAVPDMKLSLAEDRLRAYFLVNFQGKDISVVFEGKIHNVDGYLDFEPLDGKIGALPIPKASLKRALKQMAARPDTRNLLRLPSNLRDLHVEDGKLVVMYR